MSNHSKDVEKQINRIYHEVFNKVFNKNNIDKLVNGGNQAITKQINNLSNSKAYKDFAKEFARKLARKGLNKERGLWRKYYDVAKHMHYGVLPETYRDFEIKMMKNAIKHNFKMIKTIPQEVLKVYKYKYTSTLIEEVAKGNLSRGSFLKQLQVDGAKNAKVIARTESAKLQTAITEDRATTLGSVCYMWKSSNDRRTRPSHRGMNGVIVFWRKDDEEKPNLDEMFGNAGEFPNCRCDCQPIFDENDLSASTYKIYNYNTKKIQTITKIKLLEYIKKGGIA